jgi:3-mercaptopyruvate sulfurtransferase SseA
LRLKAQHLQREVNFQNARGVRQQVAADHSEERTRVMLVKVVDLRLEMVDVMAALEYDFRAQSQFTETIDHPREHHHATFRGDRSDQYS